MTSAERATVEAKDVSPQYQIDIDNRGVVIRFNHPTEGGLLLDHALKLLGASRSIARCARAAQLFEEESADSLGNLFEHTLDEAAAGSEFLQNMAYACLEQASLAEADARRMRIEGFVNEA